MTIQLFYHSEASDRKVSVDVRLSPEDKGVAQEMLSVSEKHALALQEDIERILREHNHSQAAK